MSRVFISSTCYDLVDLRAELKVVLEDAGLKPVMSDETDHFEISGRADSIETCLANVRSSDVFVCVLSQRYGPSLKGSGYPDISATHLEYREAKDLSLPIYMFVRDRLEGEHALARKHRKKHGSLDGFQTRWVPSGSHQLFDFLDEHLALIKGASTTNWYTTFSTSIDLKERIQQQLQVVSSRALVTRLLDGAHLPIIGAKPVIWRDRDPMMRGVQLRNLSTIPALDVTVSVGASGAVTFAIGDVLAAGETDVALAKEAEPFPGEFALAFTTPAGYRLSQQFVADGNRYKRAVVRLLDKTGFQIG